MSYPIQVYGVESHLDHWETATYPVRPNDTTKREATAGTTVPKSPSPKDTLAQLGGAVTTPFAPEPLSIPVPVFASFRSPDAPSAAGSETFASTIQSQAKAAIDAIYQEGRILQARGNLEEAARCWREVLDRDPNYEKGLFILAFVSAFIIQNITLSGIGLFGGFIGGIVIWAIWAMWRDGII